MGASVVIGTVGEDEVTFVVWAELGMVLVLGPIVVGSEKLPSQAEVPPWSDPTLILCRTICVSSSSRVPIGFHKHGSSGSPFSSSFA